MPFKAAWIKKMWRVYPVRVGLAAAGWIVLISFLHHFLNIERDRRQIVNMGYMPVITNLAAPLLDAASMDDATNFRFKAVKFSSFAEMAEALRNGQIQAAFIIAPLAIVLHQQNTDVRVVYIGNRHESTLVVRNGLPADSLIDLVGRTVAVPMRFSGHNLALLKRSHELGINERIRIVEMNPPDMAAAMAAGSLDAYFVGEPFAAQALHSGTGKLLYHVEQLWPGFICNLLLVRQQFIDSAPGAVAALVQGAARSGLWAQNNLPQSARIASRYWGQPVDLVQYALTTPEQRIVYDKFVPIQQELEMMADIMADFGMIADAKIDGLVVDRFARRANLAGIGSELSTIVQPSP